MKMIWASTNRDNHGVMRLQRVDKGMGAGSVELLAEGHLSESAPPGMASFDTVVIREVLVESQSVILVTTITLIKGGEVVHTAQVR